MNRKSSILISAGLVLALVAGMTSRVLTFHPSAPVAAAAPVRVVVQQAAPTQAPVTFTDGETEGR
jgi:hypothetical protein